VIRCPLIADCFLIEPQLCCKAGILVVFFLAETAAEARMDARSWNNIFQYANKRPDAESMPWQDVLGSAGLGR